MFIKEFAAPSTPEAAAADGMDFGFERVALSRELFERELDQRLRLLFDILGLTDQGAVIIAAFDNSAWDAWEIGKG